MNVCAFVGVTFQKTQTISPLHALNTWIIAYYLPLLKVLLQVKTHQNPDKHAPRKGLQAVANCAIVHIVPVVQIIQKVAFLPFWSPKIREKHFLVLTKRLFFGLFGIFEGKRKGQKGLNAWTPPRTDKPRQAPTSTKTTGGGKFSTPGVVERRGGGE